MLARGGRRAFYKGEAVKMIKKAFFIIIIILAAVAVSGFFKAPEKPVKKVHVEYTVQAGDTMWAIATRAAETYGDGRDIRVIIHHISKDNGGSVDIYPGQKLVLNLEAQE